MKCVVQLCLPLLPVMVMLAGCATTEPQREATHTAGRSLIFNPHGNYYCENSTYRSSWPSTEGFGPGHEVVSFRETIHDRQGRNGRSEDYLYRRFDSVRIGRIRR